MELLLLGENGFKKNGIWYMPTFHPAALLRDDTKKIDFWKDLKQVEQKQKELREIQNT